jgi:Alpha/beta hydrolase of unknown function (DUF900)
MNTIALAQTTYPFIASTRNFFDTNTGGMVQDLPPALSILGTSSCPTELGIYVHGWAAKEEDAIEQTERVFLSLQRSGYNISIIGFSWDSDIEWDAAKKMANENGYLLAGFIKEFKNKCPTDNLRIIAHSLGSRVTLSAIQSLYDNHPLETVSKIITSVHLLGAAVDDEQVSLDNQNECMSINSPPLRCSGDAINLVVKHFYNLFNPEDNMLAPQIIPYCPIFCSCPWCSYYESAYYLNENDNPLGSYPIKNVINVPMNYEEYNVREEIGLNEDADGDGKCDLELQGTCTIIYTGDNHLGYMGYRSSINFVVTSSEVLNLVTLDWRREIN